VAARPSSILKQLSLKLASLITPQRHIAGTPHTLEPAINFLPDELLLKIFEYACHDKRLGFLRETRDKCALVCRRWHAVTLTPDLWRDLHIALQNAMFDAGPLKRCTMRSQHFPINLHLHLLPKTNRLAHVRFPIHALRIISSNAQHIRSVTIILPSTSYGQGPVNAVNRILEYPFPSPHHPHGVHPIARVQVVSKVRFEIPIKQQPLFNRANEGIPRQLCLRNVSLTHGTNDLGITSLDIWHDIHLNITEFYPSEGFSQLNTLIIRQIPNILSISHAFAISPSGALPHGLQVLGYKLSIRLS
jgi:hypothetical protein